MLSKVLDKQSVSLQLCCDAFRGIQGTGQPFLLQASEEEQLYLGRDLQGEEEGGGSNTCKGQGPTLVEIRPHLGQHWEVRLPLVQVDRYLSPSMDISGMPRLSHSLG